jgi:hypothetical protein
MPTRVTDRRTQSLIGLTIVAACAAVLTVALTSIPACLLIPALAGPLAVLTLSLFAASVEQDVRRRHGYIRGGNEAAARSSVASPAGAEPAGSEIPEPADETVRLIFDQLSEQLASQFEQMAALNTRAQQLLTFSGTLLGAFVVLRPPGNDMCAASLYAGGLVLFLLVAWSVSRAWSIQAWRRDPNPKELWQRYQLWPDNWLRQQLVLNWVDSFEHNRVRIEAKARYLQFSALLVGTEVVYLVGFMIARPYLS